MDRGAKCVRLLEPWEVAALVDVRQHRRGDEAVDVFGVLVAHRILVAVHDQRRPTKRAQTGADIEVVEIGRHHRGDVRVQRTVWDGRGKRQPFRSIEKVSWRERPLCFKGGLVGSDPAFGRLGPVLLRRDVFGPQARECCR